jgi:hypothetical protein
VLTPESSAPSLHNAPALTDVLLHCGLEGVGAGIGVYAYNLCNHTWHRVAMWAALTLVTSYLTVGIVG